MSDEQSRTRTFSWENPLIGAKGALKLSGLEYMQAMLRGEFPPPPVAHTLNFWLTEAVEGRAIFTFTPAEYHYNPIGTVHGGVISTLCDSAMGCAVHTTLPAGTGYTTVELKVNFVKAVHSHTSELFCEGQVIHAGSRIITAEAKLLDKAGTLYAHSTTTCLVLHPKKEH